MGEDKDAQSLSSVFDQALELHSQLESSNEDSGSESYQSKLRKGILMLEDATRLVSLLDLFSRNENYKEIPTEHLKYFMLPVLLGDLNARLTENERGDTVEACQIYYIDYLQRCKDYGFTDIKIPKLKAVKVDGDDENPGPLPGGRPDIAKMESERQEKVARFRLKKELESEIKELRQLSGFATRDEDVMRDLYIKMIKRFVFFSLDELSSLHMEVDVLRHMAAVRQGKVEDKPEVKKSRPLQPIIITKDKLQKEVYGLGYPSLPVMSVDEFYEQRVREGWWQPPSSSASSLQDRAADSDAALRQEEEEAREKEEKEERDDPEELEKKRNWDEWKDDHRRGEGNRKNMG